MTKLEEVARALCVGNDSISACFGECGVKLEQARAALLALREPSEGMREALSATGLMWRDLNSQMVWECYIDHILSEAP